MTIFTFFFKCISLLEYQKLFRREERHPAHHNHQHIYKSIPSITHTYVDPRPHHLLPLKRNEAGPPKEERRVD